MAERMTPQGLMVGLLPDEEEKKSTVTVVDKAPLKVNIAQISKAHVGGELTLDVQLPPDATYQWKSSNTPMGSFADIEGATEESYKPTSADIGSFVKCEVTLDGETVTTKSKKVS